jgi:type II secretion system protein N
VKERLTTILRWAAFPAFYLLCLGLFGYLSFPYGRLKDRVIAEFEKRGRPGQRLEIGKLGTYWFSGIEVSNVKVHLPIADDTSTGLPHTGSTGTGADDAGPKETVITIDEAHVRVRMLPLLVGRVQVDFWASAFGGELEGTAPVGTSKGDVDVEIDHVDVSKIDAIAQVVGVPMKGQATGKLSLTVPDGKLAKANGSLDLTIAGAVISDGKTKIQGFIELPPAKLGDVTLTAESRDGTLKITKLAAAGVDLELAGDGKIALKDPWSSALADLYVRFKFTDAYRGKSDMTKTLLGEPGGKLPGLIDKAPKMAQAKRTDGFYGFHVHGPLSKLRYDGSTVDVAPSTPTLGATTKRPRESLAGKRPGFPLGAPTAAKEEPLAPAPAPAPAPPPAPAAAPDPAPRRDPPPAPPPPPPPQPPPPAAAAPEPPPPQPEAPADQPAPEAPAPEAPAP